MAENKGISAIFKDNLNRLLTERDVTQKALADYVGVSTATISHWKKGVKMPRMDKVDKICAFFHVDRRDLLETMQISVNFDTELIIKAEEESLIKAYRTASDRDKNLVDTILKPKDTDAANKEVS